MWHEGLIDYTFYINLDIRDDKRQHMERLLKELGITNYERFPGVTREDWERRLPSPQGKTLEEASKRYKPGLFFASCAHYLLYKEIQKRNYKTVLILEDDAGLTDEFEKTVTTIAEWLKRSKQWKGFYFYPPESSRFIKEVDPTNHILKLKNFYLLPIHAVLLRTQALNRIIKIVDPHSEPVSDKNQRAADKRIPLALQGAAYCSDVPLFRQCNDLFCPDSNRALRLSQGWGKSKGSRTFTEN